MQTLIENAYSTVVQTAAYVLYVHLALSSTPLPTCTSRISLTVATGPDGATDLKVERLGVGRESDRSAVVQLVRHDAEGSAMTFTE